MAGSLEERAQETSFRHDPEGLDVPDAVLVHQGMQLLRTDEVAEAMRTDRDVSENPLEQNLPDKE